MRIAVAAALALFLLPHPALFAVEGTCGSSHGQSEIVVHCSSKEGETNPVGTAPGTPGSELIRYEYTWIPNCALASPSDPAASAIDCAGSHTCVDTSQILQSLYARMSIDASGPPAQATWRYVRSECRGRDALGPVRRQLTWSDVLAAIRRVGIPPGEVHAPRYTLVNLNTTFYTDPMPVDRTLQIIGYMVDVSIEPVSYTWHWGDGSTQTTHEPGRPYPAKNVTHTYSHATDPGTSLALSVDVTYDARYRVDNGGWLDVPDSITITGSATTLPVKQASAVLVTPE